MSNTEHKANREPWRPPVRARSRRRSRRRRQARLVVIWILAAAAATVILWWPSRRPDHRSAGQPSRLLEDASFRPAYAYSVVSGGVYSADEFDKAVARDPVVAAHYEALRSFRLRPIRLDSNKAAYVSYRVDNAVYWTKRPLRLMAGEKLLTDGEHLLRARCGNRISDVPRFPTRRFEPPSIAVEERDPGPDPPMIPARFGGEAHLALLGPIRIEPVKPSVDPSAETFWPFAPNGASAPPLTSTPPAAVVPEPESLVLLGSVLLFIAGKLRRRGTK